MSLLPGSNRKLEGLKSAVPEIKTMELGKSFSELPVAYDVALYSEYDSKEDYEVFLKHPEHLKVGEVHPPDKNGRGSCRIRNVISLVFSGG